MVITAGAVMELLAQFAPLARQADWDNSGLQVGSASWQVDGVLLALDINPGVVEFAVANGCQLVVSHHPLIFKKLNRIDTGTGLGKSIQLALTHDICIYSMHTNLDFAPEGVSRRLARLLDLGNLEVLERQRGDYCKLAVFVPLEHLEEVRKALGDAGAGWIGNYSHCAFAARGEGSFLPREGANPYIGSQGQLEKVAEYRLETLVPEYKLPSVLKAMHRVHPYEEVAYDIIPLANLGNFGLGCLGSLEQPLTLQELALLCGRRLGCRHVRVVGDWQRVVSRVAVCGGRGGDLIATACNRQADVLITGDIDYHQALAAREAGLALIDPGHFASEWVAVELLAEFLAGSLPDKVRVVKYPAAEDPFRCQEIR